MGSQSRVKDGVMGMRFGLGKVKACEFLRCIELARCFRRNDMHELRFYCLLY